MKRSGRFSAFRVPLCVVTFVLTSAAVALGALPADPLAKTPGWQPPGAEEVRRTAFAWLDDQKVDASVRAKAEAIWASVPSSPPGPAQTALLERLAETFALADPAARRLVELCSGPRRDPTLPDAAWLTDPKTPPFEAHNMRLAYGRWLVGVRLFEEARDQLSGLQPADVVDPASLLFYHAVACHQLLDRKDGLAALGQLLDGSRASPARYVAVARLMKADLAGLQSDSLDHIGRRMQDIERRLDLGRAGPKVRKVEDGVIDSLDKLIKDLQDQQQQAAAGANSTQSSSPAQDSRILGGKGPGEVTKKGVGSKSGWGDLPPKEREEAMQEISREFPSHYRDAIEQYFRRLAGQSSEGE